MMPVTAVILAGGMGSRIGGDKGLQLLHGKILIQWVLDAIQDQCDEILVSANSQWPEYEAFGHPVVADLLPAGAGPLAGLQAALGRARHEKVVCLPCDTPFLPRNLVSRLSDALGEADVAVAMVDGKRQPTIAIYRKGVLSGLDYFLESGQRKVGDWLLTLRVSEVKFDDASAFINVNTPEELAALQASSGQDFDGKKNPAPGGAGP